MVEKFTFRVLLIPTKRSVHWRAMTFCYTFTALLILYTKLTITIANMLTKILLGQFTMKLTMKDELLPGGQDDARTRADPSGTAGVDS